MGHISTVEVRYAETDQMGIAHHSNYAVWFEVARTDFIKAAGISYTDVEKEGIITPLTSLECKYKLIAPPITSLLSEETDSCKSYKAVSGSSGILL